MAITRRHMLLSTSFAAFLKSTRSHASPEDIVIDPVSPATAIGGAYGRFATPGEFGKPDRPVVLRTTTGLAIAIWLPRTQAPGRLRTVVFSHSELSVPTLYSPLLAHWASHGFVVAAPTHDDSVIEQGLNVRSRGGRWDLGTMLSDENAWLARCDACRHACDAASEAAASSGLALADEPAAIAGHSFGAFTASLLVGVRARIGDTRIIGSHDGRFSNGIFLSPQGRGVLGLTDGSWDGLTVPATFVTGAGDEDASLQSPQKKSECFTLSPSGNKILGWCNFITPTIFSGDGVASGSASEMVFLDILALTTASLRSAYGDTDARSILATDYLERASAERLRLYRR